MTILKWILYFVLLLVGLVLMYFGDDPDPGKVEWLLEGTDNGTLITWKFTAHTSYPVERLMLNLFSGQMISSFKKGLANFSVYLEANLNCHTAEVIPAACKYITLKILEQVRKAPGSFSTSFRSGS